MKSAQEAAQAAEFLSHSSVRISPPLLAWFRLQLEAL